MAPVARIRPTVLSILRIWPPGFLSAVTLALVAWAALPVRADSIDDIRGWSFTKSLPDNYKPYGFNVVDRADRYPVRTGPSSLRFEVQPGDCSWQAGGWNDCEHDRERHELKAASWSGGEGWYQWSVYLPRDYPVIFPAKVALGQFHQESGHVAWMFQNKDGGLAVDNQVQGSTLHLKPILSDADMRGHWSDILVHARWSAGKDGFFRVFVNGETMPRYAWSGPTQSAGKRVYFKFGIYRSYVSRRPGKAPAQVVYYDDVAAGSECEDAATHFDCAQIRLARQ